MIGIVAGRGVPPGRLRHGSAALNVSPAAIKRLFGNHRLPEALHRRTYQWGD